MSQDSNNVLNGPSPEYTSNTKDDITNRDMLKVHQNGSSPQSPLSPQPASPSITSQRPLARLDSRTNFQYRPPFPTQSIPPRPGQPIIRQAVPPGNQQVPIRSPTPGVGPPRPQGPPPVTQGQPFVANQQRPLFRPSTPFPRPTGVPNQRSPFQQRSASSFGGVPRPSIPEDTLIRSQTLDSSEIDYSKSSDDKIPSTDFVKTPSIAAINNRSYSLSSNPPEQVDLKDDGRRKSVSSVDSYGEGKTGSRPTSRQGSISGSSENLEKKPEIEIPSRPESRSTSRMNKIVEDDDRSPGSLTDVSQKSPDLSYLSDSISKSQPTVSKTPDSTSSNRPQVLKNLESAAKVKPNRSENMEHAFKERSSVRSEGDNDSGVDESTQGNEISNGDNRTPRKSTKSPRTSSTTPARSLSRGSKSPSLKSPDSNATTPGSATERKKVPMNKVQVGSAPSPNLKVIKSKIGSLDNANYKPGGGKIKIESKKLDFKAAAPRIEAKNDKYTPKGGERKIVQQKLVWNAKSKIGSLDNTTHKPKGGEKKIESIKLDFKEKAKSKVGSRDNIKHQPGGGDIKSSEEVEEDKDIGTEKNKNTIYETGIENKKIELNAASKVGSLDNMKHRPGGGEKKIFDDKDYLKQKSSAVSSIDHSLSGSQNSLPSQPDKHPVADENLNQEH